MLGLLPKDVQRHYIGRANLRVQIKEDRGDYFLLRVFYTTMEGEDKVDIDGWLAMQSASWGCSAWIKVDTDS